MTPGRIGTLGKAGSARLPDDVVVVVLARHQAEAHLGMVGDNHQAPAAEEVVMKLGGELAIGVRQFFALARARLGLKHVAKLGAVVLGLDPPRDQVLVREIPGL